jgi:hypothetical protein
LLSRASLLLPSVEEQNTPKFAADINNDGIVNFADFAAFADKWLPDEFSQFNNTVEDLRYFAIPMADNVMLEKHLFCFSGNLTVNPLTTKAGFQKIYSPPYSASTFVGEFKPFNITAAPVNYIWYPSEFYCDYGKINNVKIESTLVPISGSSAVVFAVKLSNTTANSISIPFQFVPSGATSYISSSSWGWTPPSSSGTITNYVQDSKLIMDNGSEGICIGMNTPWTWTSSTGVMAGTVALTANESKIIYITLSLGNIGEVETIAANVMADTPGFIADSRRSWCNEINQLRARVPEISTDNPDLKMFYDRSLLTLLTCKWKSSAMAANPWYSESGIDGGAVCNYIWGTSYIGNLLAMADPNALKNFLLLFLDGDLLNHYAITPIDGSATGPYYSYNKYSLLSLLYSYVMITGDTAFLTQAYGSTTILQQVSSICLDGEDLASTPALVNYGVNSNLLELKKTMAYQYYVPSPNAERCLIFEQLAKLYDLAGINPPADLNTRSAQLKTVIRDALWSSSLNWFNARNNYYIFTTTAYSLQIYDLLRTGVPTSTQAAGILSHLNATEFLSKYGIHSLSKTDSGYDTTDVDWGGPGVYAGDAPQIVEDLYASGYDSYAQDILRRILWWGKTFPYYPQAIYANQRYYRTDGRANVIAGFTAAQSIVFGVFGVTVQSDRIIINPHTLDFAEQLKLKNLKIRNKTLDIEILPASGTFKVTDADNTITSSIGSAVTIMF